MLTWSRVTFIACLGLLTVVLAPSCAIQRMSGRESRQYVMLNQSLVLSDAEIKTLSPQALKGSADAAMRLFGYYEYVRHDYKQSHYWAQIAAENGGHGGAYTYGFILKEDDSPQNRLRARFWLERAAKAGDKESEDLLRELSE